MSNPKKPVKLKILEGNPGHESNLNYDEPIPETGDPDIPDRLTPRATTIWENTCHHLRMMGILAKCDEVVIESFARIVSRWQTLEREIDEEGQFMTIPMRKGDNILLDADNNIITTTVANPRLIEARLLSQQMRIVAGDLGLSPSSRAKLSVTSAAPPKKSRMEELLERGRNAS